MNNNCLRINLPYPPLNKFVLPYALCRGAVFSSNVYIGKNKNNRTQYTHSTLISEWGKEQVFQTAGEQLNQASADVYCELIRQALLKEFVDDERIIISIHADKFLEAIGRKRGSNNRIWLNEEIARLKHATFRFKFRSSPEWAGSFIVNFTEERGLCNVSPSLHYSIELNSQMYAIFQQGWQLFDRELRLNFHAKKGQLAKALYCFYESHNKPLAFTEELLKRQMGRSELKDTTGNVLRKPQQNSKWLADLTAALKTIKEATGWPTCELDKKNGKVIVKKPEKPSTKNQSKEVSNIPSEDDWEI